MSRLKTIVGFFLILLFFVLVAPGNHSEAEDAFEYARLIEQGQGAHLFHPHHLLFLPLERGIFKLAQSLGYTGRSYFVAQAVSMLSGAWVLFCFFGMLGRFQQSAEESSPLLPWIPTAGLLFSYGFLRYACEVEIYLPAMAFAALAVGAALRGAESRLWFWAGVSLSSLALLTHVLNAGVALVAVPLIYLLLFKNRKRALFHALFTLLFVGGIYFWIHTTWGTFHPEVKTGETGLSIRTLWKAAVGLGQCLLSANFFFAYTPIAEKLQELFPYRMFAEELFMAAQMPVWIKFLAPWSFLLALTGLLGGTTYLLVRLFKLGIKGLREKALTPPFWIFGAWLGGTVAPTLWLEPSNPELWVMALLPLWGLFFVLLSATKPSPRTLRIISLAVVCLGLHNVLAGMGTIHSKQSDYNFCKAKWILNQAQAGDVLHTADSFVFSFYLDYWSGKEVEVRNLNTQEWKSGKTTYLLDDLFHPISSILLRYPEFASRLAQTRAELQPLCQKVHEDSFGGVWIVAPTPSP